MKVAIIMAGPYRANQSILENHLSLFGKYDTYVSCFEHYKKDWIESGWSLKDIFITPKIDFTQTNWAKYRNDKAGKSGFWQFWNLRNVITNMPNDYDFYIKNRCDLQFSEFNIDMESLQPNILYSSAHNFHENYWDRDNLINDQFYIGDWNTMNTISNFVTSFYKKDRHKLNEAGPYVGSNEASLRQFLNETEINVKALEGIKYIKNHNQIHTPSGISGFQLEKE